MAITDGDQLIASYQLMRGYSHAEKLPGAIEKVMSDANLTPDAIEGIAVSIGPGSFTGLRIGLGVAKGMALALDKPVVAVPTMDVLVGALPHDLEQVCASLYARKGEVYMSLYQAVEGCWGQTEGIRTSAIERIESALPDNSIFVLGEGVSRNLEAFQNIQKCKILASHFHTPDPFHVARLGAIRLNNGEIEDVDSLVPLYIKRFQGIA